MLRNCCGKRISIGYSGARPLCRWLCGLARTRQIADVVLKTPSLTVATEIEVRGAVVLGCRDRDAEFLHELARLHALDSPNGLQTPSRSVVDPEPLPAKDSVDLSRQRSRVGEEVDQDRPHDAIDRTAGE